MKIQFLGTAASPSAPLPFCQCPVCIQARLSGGKNLRRRSSIKINDDMLIDIGPDIMSSSYEFNISISDITICLQTHFHEDHFDPEMIISRHSDYGNVGLSDLLLVASRQTLEMMDIIIGRRCGYGSIFDTEVQEAFRIRIAPIEPFESYNTGDYQITGYPANHGGNGQGCLLFKVVDKDKCMFYGTDTSVLHEELWKHFDTMKTKFDLIILDCTYGIGYESEQGGHLATKDFISHVQRFNSSGILRNLGQVYATHISHEGTMEHEEFEAYATVNNFHIAFDGLKVIIE